MNPSIDLSEESLIRRFKKTHFTHFNKHNVYVMVKPEYLTLGVCGGWKPKIRLKRKFKSFFEIENIFGKPICRLTWYDVKKFQLAEQGLI